MPDIDYPIYDADNHFYEPEEAITAHLPKKFAGEFRYVEVNGRKKLAIAGRLSEYIPNPTFEVVAPPGAHETWFRATNTEGKTLRELSGKPIKCPDAYRRPEPRIELMDDQKLAGTLMFPTLASTIEVNLSTDHELVHAVIHSLNEWIFGSTALGEALQATANHLTVHDTNKAKFVLFVIKCLIGVLPY